MSIVVVVPSRGRPLAAQAAIESVRQTAARVDTSVVLAVDANDPRLDDYRALRFPGHGPEVSTVVLEDEETGDLTRATNTVSLRIAEEDPEAIIGNLNDDHRARSPSWDRVIRMALATPGIAYGRDLIHDQRLPSAPFISARIVLALGWYALPTCHHMYIDDAWRQLGLALGCLRYRPEIVFEHLHAAVDKAIWDEGYDRAYASVDADHAAFDLWMETGLEADAARVLAAIGVPA